VRFVLYDEKTLRRFLEVATGLLLGTEDAFRFDDEVDAPVTRDEASSAPTMFVAQKPLTRAATERLAQAGGREE
jgi:hypothetical protein